MSGVNEYISNLTKISLFLVDISAEAFIWSVFLEKKFRSSGHVPTKYIKGHIYYKYRHVWDEVGIKCVLWSQNNRSWTKSVDTRKLLMMCVTLTSLPMYHQQTSCVQTSVFDTLSWLFNRWTWNVVVCVLTWVEWVLSKHTHIHNPTSYWLTSYANSHSRYSFRFIYPYLLLKVKHSSHYLFPQSSKLVSGECKRLK